MEAKPLRQRVIESMNAVFTGERGRPETHYVRQEERQKAFEHAHAYFLRLLDGEHEVEGARDEADRIAANLEQRIGNALAAFLDFTKGGFKHLVDNPGNEDVRKIAAKLVPLVEITKYTGVQNAHKSFTLLVGHDNLASLMHTGMFDGSMKENFGIQKGDERTERVLSYLNTHLKPLVLAKAREMYGLKSEGASEIPKNIPSWAEVLSGKSPEKPAEPKKSGVWARLFGRGKRQEK